jgi:hypothetical protein
VRRSRSRIECALCGQTLSGITPRSRVQKVIAGASGRENMRVVLVDGIEVHRCRALGPPTGRSAAAV